MIFILALLSLAIWLYLLGLHGGFWRADQWLEELRRPADDLPPVIAVVPARNEAEVIGRSLRSLLSQNYQGSFRIVLVDDHSGDETGVIAAALAAGSGGRLTVTGARPLPAGWTGKLWALSEGLRRAAEVAPEARYILFTDADIEHDPASLSRLVLKAEADRLDMVSLMVLLDHDGFWGRLLIPAFVFFFQKLYPFRWVNDPARTTAAAAGGCVLLRREAFERAGGLEPIRSELIDDCALACRMKGSGGRIWLGLTTAVRSLRDNGRFGSIAHMVTRTAYTQLRHSPLRLAGTLAGMVLVYLVPPLALLLAPLHGNVGAAVAGAVAWALMAWTFRPTLRLYGGGLGGGGFGRAFLLPIAGLLYSLMTVASAVRHWRGRGGQWKGRVHGVAAGADP